MDKPIRVKQTFEPGSTGEMFMLHVDSSAMLFKCRLSMKLQKLNLDVITKFH